MAAFARFARFSWAVLAANLAVIAWGALVRASGSGAGCGSHWPDCNGEIAHRPESIETAIELTHRITSGLALVLVIAQVLWAFRIFERAHPARRAAIASMALMLTEAAIGAGIVVLELVGQNASAARAGWIALHLTNTFLLVAALTLTAHHAGAPRRRTDPSGGLGWMLGASALALLLTGVAGAVTALGDTLLPAGAISGDHLLVQLRIVHPFFAVAAFLGIAVAAFSSIAMRPDPGVRRAAFALVAILAAQMLVGLVNVLLAAPIVIQLLHLVLADIAWIALVLLGARVLAAEPHTTPARDGGTSHAAPTP